VKPRAGAEFTRHAVVPAAVARVAPAVSIEDARYATAERVVEIGGDAALIVIPLALTSAFSCGAGPRSPVSSPSVHSG
jgi:hypothetical protein